MRRGGVVGAIPFFFLEGEEEEKQTNNANNEHKHGATPRGVSVPAGPDPPLSPNT